MTFHPEGLQPEEPHKLKLATFVALCALAWLVLLSYALARPAIESLFLHRFGSDMLPITWIAVAAASAFAALGWQRALTRLSLGNTFTIAATLSAVSLPLLLLAERMSPATCAVLYVWKDLYVVILVEGIWSFANLTFTVEEARWRYGIFCLFGSAGGVCGNLTASVVSSTLGTRGVLWTVPMILLAAAFVSMLLSRQLKVKRHAQRLDHKLSLTTLLRDSTYLRALLLLVAVVQITITLVDFRFNQTLESTYPNIDQRTSALGKVYAIVDGSAFVLQLITGPVLRVLGVNRVMSLIPLMLFISAMAALLSPRFWSMSLLKVCSKSLDYSLFRAAKEIAYIPLAQNLKTLGKSLIDIFTYRSAKAAASVLLLILVPISSPQVLMGLVLSLLILWLILARGLMKQFDRRRVETDPKQ